MRLILLLTLGISLSYCSAQEVKQPRAHVVGGPCEGCEALLEYGERSLTAVDTLPDFHTTVPQLHLYGTVYQADGETPAEGVIIYIYHTNREGRYPPAKGAEGWARRHGYIRGWVKTAADGRYDFYTFRPGAYPGRDIPEHIHMTVQENGLTPYYIDDIEFLDDPFLTESRKAQRRQRAGSGIVMPQKQGHILAVQRDIFLGRNIPGYP